MDLSKGLSLMGAAPCCGTPAKLPPEDVKVVSDFLNSPAVQDRLERMTRGLCTSSVESLWNVLSQWRDKRINGKYHGLNCKLAFLDWNRYFLFLEYPF